MLKLNMASWINLATSSGIYSRFKHQTVILMTLLTFYSSFSHAQDWLGNVITDPAISKRCDDLAKKREQKLIHKQRLMALMKRTTHLQKIAPEEKKTVRLRLDITEGQIKQELDLTRLVIEQLEEGIIRKGCPGIAL